MVMFQQACRRVFRPDKNGQTISNNLCMNQEVHEITQSVQRAAQFLQPLREQIGRVIVGQKGLIDRLLIALLADGHALLEGVPGLAKTLAVRTLARCCRMSFSRIQFTPDMLPADIIGTQIFNVRTGEFTTKKGPIFANLVLADEINRAPAKVQSALLEAMQERQVTIGEQTHRLPNPFLVLATQNPIEQEGTYPLPEAQLDRFLLKIRVGYPSRQEERQILERMARISPIVEPEPIVGPEELSEARLVLDSIFVDERIKEYIVDLIFATREPERFRLPLKRYIELGASPRATIAMVICSKAYAFLQGRGYVTPEDVKAVAPDVLRHRIIVTYEAEAEDKNADWVIGEILRQLPVP